MEVIVLNRQRAHAVSRRSLESFVARLARRAAAGDARSVALCLVSDHRMRELNRHFRGKDATTDVLSFPAGATVDPADRHLGDIVISVPAAWRQARRARHSLSAELRTLALHGYLHLLGYDHESDDGTMLRLERRLSRELIRARPARPRP